MSARDAFVALARAQLGKRVLWAKDGPDVYDCSGLVAYCLLQVGGRDFRATHTAQRFADETPALETYSGALPLPGDLCFYGLDDGHVSHIAIWLDGGGCISADGATKRIRTLEEAEKANARVRQHDSWRWRRDALSIHRNVFVDSLDGVCR